jgi:hypothetical protein
MNSPLSRITHELPLLGVAELDDVIARAKLMRSMTRGAETSVNPQTGRDDVQFVLEVIASAMAREDYSSPSLLRKSSQFASFKTKVPALIEYLKPAGSRNQQRALLRLGVELLQKYMTGIGVPTGSRVIMQNIHRVPAVIETQFPGYAREGLLRMIMREED